MNEFVKIPNYGLLKIDRVIFEASYPILFTCLSEKNELFVCVCCQNNDKGKKWLISKVSSDTMVKMLKDEIPIRDAFLEDSCCRITVHKYKEKTDIYFDDENDWSENSIYLPQKGEYLEADPDEFCEEIAYYQNRETIPYSEKYSNLVGVVEEVQSDVEPVSIEFPLVEFEVNTKEILVKYVETLKTFEKLHLDTIQKIMFEYTYSHCFKELQTFDLEKIEHQQVELNKNRSAGLLGAA